MLKTPDRDQSSIVKLRRQGHAHIVSALSSKAIQRGRLWTLRTRDSHLQYIAFARHRAIEHWIYKETKQEPGKQPCHNHNGEWPLRIRTNAGGEGSGQKSQAGDECGH